MVVNISLTWISVILRTENYWICSCSIFQLRNCNLPLHQHIENIGSAVNLAWYDCFSYEAKVDNLMNEINSLITNYYNSNLRHGLEIIWEYTVLALYFSPLVPIYVINICIIDKNCPFSTRKRLIVINSFNSIFHWHIGLICNF